VDLGVQNTNLLCKNDVVSLGTLPGLTAFVNGRSCLMGLVRSNVFKLFSAIICSPLHCQSSFC
jgi:hypothetical protein